MPIIDMPVELLMSRINRGAAAAHITADELVKRLPHMGCAVEGFAQTRQYACRSCDKAFDRTEAQGPPLHCTHCGADFRAAPDKLLDRGPNRVVRLEMLAVRPDLFDAGGMSRFVRGYLGVQTGLTRYAVAEPKFTVKVDPKLSLDFSLRPHIACAVLRNVQLGHDAIKLLMNLQEDLHWALGRNRKLASIGVYDLDTLRGTTIRYDAVRPDSLRFTPLGGSLDDESAWMTPADILQKHKTGIEFAHLLKGMSSYPLLRDEVGTVLSMPPIINSEATRVTMRSRQLFIDVTGLSRRSVDRALNILVTSLAEILPEARIEGVVIDAPDGRRTTPDLAPAPLRLGVKPTADTIGVDLTAASLRELLERMGHAVTGVSAGADELDVLVPAYRNDVMHPVDLIEDAAIALGYDRLTPRLVQTATLGLPRAIEEQSAVVRRIMTGLGFHQVMTLTLSDEASTFDKWRLAEGDSIGDALRASAVKLANPISSEQTMCRISLLPGIIATLADNKEHDLPQQLFEVGDVCVVDREVETGAREERTIAAAMIGSHVGYADIRAVTDALARELAVAIGYRATQHPSFLPGRVAELLDGRGRPIGRAGELHPEVLERYGLRHATSVMELSLQRLLA